MDTNTSAKLRGGYTGTNSSMSKCFNIFYIEPNDYLMYEKTFMKKSKKILNKIEESRKRSNSRGMSRSISPVCDKNNTSYLANSNLIDTRKYVSIADI